MISLALIGAMLGAASIHAVPAGLSERAGSFEPSHPHPGPCGFFPADSSCSAIFQDCRDQVDSQIDALTSDVCVAAALCWPSNVDGFLTTLNCVKSAQPLTYTSAMLPRISDAIFNNISNNQPSVTLNSLTTWYDAKADGLPTFNGTVTVVPDFVDEIFDIVSAWTGFCYEPTDTRAIPKQNFEDWLQYSSTVSGPATSCTCETAPPACEGLMLACAADSSAATDPFSVTECVSGAACWPTGIDHFLGAVACTNSKSPVLSVNAPRLSQSIFNTATGGNAMSQQNYIDLVYGSESAINSNQINVTYPNVETVIAEWQEILRWTGFCIAGTVPYGNLADWYQYSSSVSVSSPSCSAQQCVTDPDASCQFMLQSCVAYANAHPGTDIVHNPFAIEICVLAATCLQGGVHAFAQAIGCATSTTPTSPPSYTRLDQGLFNSIALTNGLLSLQNYIDAYYGTLSQLSTPVWPSVGYVINNFNTIAAWTQIGGDQPYGNFADWFQYS